ncbi:hypothetical protein L218DRAFT_956557 [Marasmius fiardii PR-910]|nr:hypothetical protein L218DRAFT_956557 [Marasmius fiardii PR-910]
MSIESSVGEPFTLSTYGIPQRLSKSGKLSSTTSDVYATYHKSGGSSDGYVTVAAQGDGVHVLDLSTLHPVISHTLGPSTTFCCPPVSCSISNGDSRVCTTYAGIASSSETSSDDDLNSTIWSWSENLSNSVADRASQKRKAVSLSHPISGLFINPDLPSRLLASSPNSDWTLLDDHLKVLTTRESGGSEIKLKKAFVFARQSCRFLPSHTTPPQATIIISLLEFKDSFRISVLALDANTDTFVELGDLTLDNLTYVSDVSCTHDGILSFLTQDGSWTSFEMKSPNNTLQLITLPDKLLLGNLSFLASSGNEDVSIIALTSFHVLFAGFTGASSNREIALLLWDLQYCVLLASRIIPIPTNLTSNSLTLRLVDSMSSSNVLLLLSPSPSAPERRKSSGGTSATSTILVVPIVVPPSSSIANAVGRAAAGITWLAKDEVSEGVNVNGESPYDSTRKKVVFDMRAAIEHSRPQSASDAFFAWEKRELAEVKKKASDDGAKEDSEAEPRISYGYAFVKDVLNAVLRPTQPQNTPYSSQVVRHLLEKKVVSTNMSQSGLLSALRLRNDWSSIKLAFSTVPDLQELEIIDTLRYVLARHRHTHQPTASSDNDSDADVDAMQIDPVAPITPIQDDMPSLQDYLTLCLGYKVSETPLRFALKRYMKDVDDVVCLLGVLDTWIGLWTSRELQLMPSKKLLEKNQFGVVVVKGDNKKSDMKIPSFKEVLFFVQVLLDISFVNLIQNPASHRVLRRIQSRIEPEIESIDETEKLRGPLQVFAVTHSKAIKNAKEASEGKNAPKGDWRQRRKLAQDQAGMGIGLYQLEELVL